MPTILRQMPCHHFKYPLVTDWRIMIYMSGRLWSFGAFGVSQKKSHSLETACTYSPTWTIPTTNGHLKDSDVHTRQTACPPWCTSNPESNLICILFVLFFIFPHWHHFMLAVVLTCYSHCHCHFPQKNWSMQVGKTLADPHSKYIFHKIYFQTF